MVTSVEFNQSTKSSFNILNYIERLTPTKEKGRYICPVCEGNNFTVNSKSGAYSCWSGCESKDIREAVSPSKGYQEGKYTSRKTSKPKRKPKPAPLPDIINLVKLTAPATDRPQRKVEPDPDHGNINVIKYNYSDTQWVIRTEWADPKQPKGYDKTFRQWHRNEEGKAIRSQGDKPWQPYRIDEAMAAIKTDESTNAKGLLFVEGEECVEELRSVGIAGITTKGGAWSESALMALAMALKEADPNAVFIYLKDNDDIGSTKAQKVLDSCTKVGLACIVIDPVAIYPGLPEKGDVVDILKVMDSAEFIRKLEEEIHRAVEEQRNQEAKAAADSQELESEESEENESGSDWTQNLETEVNQLALKFHYADSDKPWICVDDALYQWVGTHYKARPDAIEMRKISSYLNAFPVRGKKDEIRFPYANPHKVREVLNWVKIRLTVDPALVNPPGLNCRNGVLQIHWDKDKPSWELIPHDPNLYYLYEPCVEFKPNANPEHCDRLLQVLDVEQREIFLRTIAASLDLETVRRYKGRLVRALLLKGHGANGKDALREAVATMYGFQAICSASLSDFADYDKGRKFTLARTDGARVNWSSENGNLAKIDTIQSLKSFISGDPISRERKGKDEVEFTPKAITLFNVNDVPNLQGSQEAILSRYGVLVFSKTFKVNADPTKGELEADPRFKYDPDFLRNEVLPALLNQILTALTNLMNDGIDYRCTQEALRDIQRENSHLIEFCQMSGLDYKPDSCLSAQAIWERLRQFYLDNGTLAYENSGNGKPKAIWTDQAGKRDRNVKGANQVIARFQELFPKAKRMTVGKGQVVLSGIGFFDDKNDGTNPPKNGNNPSSPPPNDGTDPPNEGNKSSSPQNNDGNLRGSCGAVAGQLAGQKPLPDKGAGAVGSVSTLGEENKISSAMSESRTALHNFKNGKEDKAVQLTRLPRQLDIACVTAPASAPVTAPQVAETAPQAVKTAEVSAAQILEMARDILIAPNGIMVMVFMDLYCNQSPKIRERILKCIPSEEWQRIQNLKSEAQDKAQPGDKCKVRLSCGSTFEWLDAKFIAAKQDPQNLAWTFELEDGQRQDVVLRSDWLLLELDDAGVVAEIEEVEEIALIDCPWEETTKNDSLTSEEKEMKMIDAMVSAATEKLKS